MHKIASESVSNILCNTKLSATVTEEGSYHFSAPTASLSTQAAIYRIPVRVGEFLGKTDFIDCVWNSVL